MDIQKNKKNSECKVLVTGCAGFIGFSVSQKLLDSGFSVTGIDNLNGYYSVALKQNRLDLLKKDEKFIFHKVDIADAPVINEVFSEEKFDYRRNNTVG